MRRNLEGLNERVSPILEFNALFSQNNLHQTSNNYKSMPISKLNQELFVSLHPKSWLNFIRITNLRKNLLILIFFLAIAGSHVSKNLLARAKKELNPEDDIED